MDSGKIRNVLSGVFQMVVGKVFVLGGNGDIGSEVVEKFKRAGFSVVAPSSKVLDLSDLASVEGYFKSHTPDASILIHCAGVNEPKPCDALTSKDLAKTMAINTFGFFRVVQHFLPCLKADGSGSIVVISSVYGTFARDGRLAYVMSKHALNGLVKTLAIELGQFNIKVNAVSPGFVNTKMTRKNNSEETIADFKRKIPLGRLASPAEIASAVFFLCSQENSYITGHDLMVDGGYSVGGFQR